VSDLQVVPRCRTYESDCHDNEGNARGRSRKETREEISELQLEYIEMKTKKLIAKFRKMGVLKKIAAQMEFIEMLEVGKC